MIPENKVCVYCKKEFQRNRWNSCSGKPRVENPKTYMNRQTCGYRCSYKLKKERTLIKHDSRMCEWCGGDYYLKRLPNGKVNSTIFKKRKHCSRSCATKANYMNMYQKRWGKPEPYDNVEHTCIGCLISFTRRGWPSVPHDYCSRGCYYKNFLKKRRNKNKKLDARPPSIRKGTKKYADSIATDPEALELLMNNVKSKIPPAMPQDMKDDLIQDIYEGIFSGNIPVKGMDKYIKNRITSVNKMFSKFYRGVMSIDQPLTGEDGDMSKLGDFIE